MLVACIWLGLASTRTYTLLLIGRIFLGLVEAPIEALCPSTITDTFFLHERGRLVSLYGLSVLSGNSIGPLISAFIIQSLGMNWAFYIVAMFIGASLLSMVVSMPETLYLGTRPSIVPPAGDGERSHGSKAEGVPQLSADHNAAITRSLPARRHCSQLALWSRPDAQASFRRAFWRPFVLMAYPTVLWSSCLYGLSLSWNVILGATVAQLFAPPYVRYICRLAYFTNNYYFKAIPFRLFDARSDLHISIHRVTCWHLLLWTARGRRGESVHQAQRRHS